MVLADCLDTADVSMAGRSLLCAKKSLPGFFLSVDGRGSWDGLLACLKLSSDYPPTPQGPFGVSGVNVAALALRCLSL